MKLNKIEILHKLNKKEGDTTINLLLDFLEKKSDQEEAEKVVEKLKDYSHILGEELTKFCNFNDQVVEKVMHWMIDNGWVKGMTRELEDEYWKESRDNV